MAYPSREAQSNQECLFEGTGDRCGKEWVDGQQHDRKENIRGLTRITQPCAWDEYHIVLLKL
jgi:hypothetical protein